MPRCSICVVALKADTRVVVSVISPAGSRWRFFAEQQPAGFQAAACYSRSVDYPPSWS